MEKEMGILKDRVAIVTGAASGIGKAIALRYAQEGAIVIASDLDNSSAESVVEHILNAGGRADVAVLDVSDLDLASGVLENVFIKHGRLDVLVNNAAVTKSIGFFDVTEGDWNWMHDVNARGLFFCMQKAALLMRQQGSGKIVNISSIAGKGFPLTSNISYAASKGAVITMTRLAAHALGKFNINVNSICPGATRTELYWKVVHGKMVNSDKSQEEVVHEMEAGIPIKRANDPDDIAQAALFLGSDLARNVTGQSWNVDGGLMWD